MQDKSTLLTLVDDPFTSFDPSRVLHAADFAKCCHAGQKRSSGTPYFVHLMDVASRVTQVTLDTEVIQAAYLHDVLEDTDTLEADLRRSFGDRVTSIVKQLTLPKGADGDYNKKLAIQIEAVSNMCPEAHIINAMDKLSNVTAFQYSTFSSARRVLYAHHAMLLIDEIGKHYCAYTSHGAVVLTPRGTEFMDRMLKEVRSRVRKLYLAYKEISDHG